jgi:hypothetical protein
MVDRVSGRRSIGQMPRRLRALRRPAGGLRAEPRGPVVVVQLGDQHRPGPSAGRVVLGIDGTPGAAAAVVYAFQAAARRGIGLTVIHGCNPLVGLLDSRAACDRRIPAASTETLRVGVNRANRIPTAQNPGRDHPGDNAQPPRRGLEDNVGHRPLGDQSVAGGCHDVTVVTSMSPWRCVGHISPGSAPPKHRAYVSATATNRTREIPGAIGPRRAHADHGQVST